MIDSEQLLQLLHQLIQTETDHHLRLSIDHQLTHQILIDQTDFLLSQLIQISINLQSPLQVSTSSSTKTYSYLTVYLQTVTNSSSHLTSIPGFQIKPLSISITSNPLAHSFHQLSSLNPRITSQGSSTS